MFIFESLLKVLLRGPKHQTKGVVQKELNILWYSFRDAFTGEIIFIASFVPVFHQQYFSVFTQVSNLNLSSSLLKSEDIAQVHDQNLQHAMLLKAVFPLPKEFQCNISAETKIWQQCYSNVDTNSTGSSASHNDSKHFFFQVVLGHQFLVFVLTH